MLLVGRSNTYVNLTGTSTITPGVWTHVAGVFDGTQMRVYLNGVLNGSLSTTSGPTSGTGNFHIGRFSYSFNPYYFNGLIDDVRVSNTALYTSNFTPSNNLTATGSTKGLWKFDGPNTSDSSGNNNHGTIQGGATYSNDVPGTGGGEPPQVSWLVSDHLGTARMVIDQTGSLASVKRHDYLPFGEELFAGVGERTVQLGYSGGDGIRQQFTAKERDLETGLDYFLARYYTAAQGRFTGIDPQNIVFEKDRGKNEKEAARILQSYLVQPQNWNRYSYTRNNPLAYTDPSGQCSAPAGLSKGNVGICIEAFIASATINRVGRGDNRDFAPNDAGKTNRIQIQGLVSRSAFAWNANLKARAAETHVAIGPGIQGKITVDPRQRIDKDGNLQLRLKITGENGLAGVPGAPEGAIKIDITLIITPDGRVGIEGGERTAFPSIGIYVYTMGADGKPAVATLGEGRETTPDALTQPLVPIQRVAPTCNCPKPQDDKKPRHPNIE